MSITLSDQRNTHTHRVFSSHFAPLLVWFLCLALYLFALYFRLSMSKSGGTKGKQYPTIAASATQSIPKTSTVTHVRATMSGNTMANANVGESVNASASHAKISDDESDDKDEIPWIQWWTRRRGNEFLCDISESFVHDNFNLTGLQAEVKNIRRALDVILDIEDEYDSCESAVEEIEKDAQKLYGLIHARFIVSPRGLARMVEKYTRGDFGQCPRVMCNRINLLPVGMTNKYGVEPARAYCPNCKDVYIPKTKTDMVDGSYIGTSFPHVLLLSFPELSPSTTGQFDSIYTPKIFGFRIHPSAYTFDINAKFRVAHRKREPENEDPGYRKSSADELE
eukprot:CFRG0909T1